MKKKIVLFLMIATLCLSICACKKKEEDYGSTEATQENVTEEETFESNMTTEYEDDYGWDANQDPNKPPTTPYTVPPLDEITIGDRKNSTQLSYDGTVVSFNVPQLLYSVNEMGLENGVHEDFMYDPSNTEDERFRDCYITIFLVNEGCTSDEFAQKYKDENDEEGNEVIINQYQAGTQIYNWYCNTYTDEKDNKQTLFLGTTDVGNKLYEVMIVSNDDKPITPDDFVDFFNIAVN